MIGETIAHYSITAKLGEGGMGEVYLATDTRLDRRVALKFLPSALAEDPEARERLIREARAASKLNHPNIVTIHAVEEHEGHAFIAMEYVEGQALDRLMAKEKPDLATAVSIASDIASGLAEAHAAGIVHRDLKPANIVIDTRGRARILDFGVAKLPDAAKLTQTGTTVGTIAYMSPEQAQSLDVDSRSDLFSLGVILHEMVAGVSPFGDAHPAAIMYSIVHEDPTPLAEANPETSPAIATVAGRLLEKDREARYQTGDDVVADLAAAVTDPEKAVASIPAVIKKKPRALPRAARPVLLAAVVAVIILVAKPWQYFDGPSYEAEPIGNRLAVMYFDNMADPDDSERMGEIIATLLITDLSASRYVDVVSTHRLYDIFKNLGHEGIKHVTPDVAAQAAQTARARWMLLGAVVRAQPTITLAAQLIEVATGKVLAAQRLDGDDGEDVFGLVDRLTVNLKRELGLPEVSAADPDLAVAARTTTSEEAFRLYLEGMDFYHKFYCREANERFYAALEIDSNFAMAYYRIATAIIGDETIAEKTRLLEKALEHPEKLNRLERLHIGARLAEHRGDRRTAIAMLEELTAEFPDEKEAWWNLGRLWGFALHEREAGVRAFERAIEIDPLYKQAYNYLAYQYTYMGDFTKALAAVNKYVELAPGEANPPDSRGEVYAWFGYLDEAIESYTEALAIRPEFWFAGVHRANMYFFDHQFARAESVYHAETTANSVNRRSPARSLLAAVPMYRGQFKRAIALLDAGIAADEADDERLEDYYAKFILKSRALAEMGDTVAAFAALDEGVRRMDSTTGREYRWNQVEKACLLTARGERDAVAAIAADLTRLNRTPDSTRLADVMWGNLLAAAVSEQYEDVVYVADRLHKFHYWPWDQATLARMHLVFGRIDRAVNEYEAFLNWYEHGRAFIPNTASTAHYYLGIAYEESGWTNKAIESYEAFLDIWQDCDDGLFKATDARARVTRLRTG